MFMVLNPSHHPKRRIPFIFLTLVLLASSGAIAEEFVPDEVNASDPAAGKIVDPEFDALLGQFCWISEGAPSIKGDESLWLGKIDPLTGLFDPPNGQFTRVDLSSIVTVQEIGNGCEWVFSKNGAQILYTRLEGGTTLKDRQVALATFAQGSWTAGVIEDAVGTYGPIGSMDRDDPTPGVSYQGFIAPEVPGNNARAIYARRLDDASLEQMIPTTDSLFTPGARWIPGSDSIIFTRPMDPAGRQVFIYDLDTEILEQVTDNDTEKHSASMWNAPEFGGEQVFLALEDEEYLGIYRLLDLDGDGIKTWTQSNIVDPPAQGPFIWSPEPFVVNNRSYIVMTTSTSADQASLDIPTEIWIAGIDPEQPFFRKISDGRQLVRKDPEAVVIPLDQPLVRSASPADFNLTESLSVSTTGQLLEVGSSARAPAGGRNAVLVFALPALPSGMALKEADVGVQLLNSSFPASMAADLWALSISASLDPSMAFLEDDNDPTVGTSRVKIADDLLTGAATPGSRITLGESQKQTLSDYIKAFYKANPGYNGGYNLYLRLNPDTDGGAATQGWSIAASEHSSATGPTLTLAYTRYQNIPPASKDFTLTQNLKELVGTGTLHAGSVQAKASAAGRNAIFAFDLPQLAPGHAIQRATLSFTVAANKAVPAINADLWALTIQPTGDNLPKAYLESDSDPENLHIKIANNILTPSTMVNKKISTGSSESDTLGAYLNNFYSQTPAYAGGKTLYLRLNPDGDTGTKNAGWQLYSAESGQSVRPVISLTIKSPERAWVYTSIGGTINRMETGL